MARPLHSSNTGRIATRGEDLLKLTSEVLRLHLWTPNLPIMSSKGQLLAHSIEHRWERPVNRNKDLVGLHNTFVRKLMTQLRNSCPLKLVESMRHKPGISAFLRTVPSLTRPHCLRSRTCCSQMQRTISSKPISLPINEMPLVQHSILSSKTLSPSLCTVLWMPFVHTALSVQHPPNKLLLRRVWHLLWVFGGQWTETWKTKKWSCLTLTWQLIPVPDPWNSGCRCLHCSYPHLCHHCHSNSHAIPDCPQQQSSGPARNTGVPRPSEQDKK